jgi:hypothetical protein
MCTGVEIAIMAASALSAVGAVSSGMAANNQAKTQASIYAQQAERARLEAAGNEQEFRDQQQRTMAARRAVMGGSGVDPSSGSTLLASEDFAGEVELAALKIRNGGEVNATRLEQSGMLARAKGASDMQAGLFRGGSLLLSGGAKAFG